MVIHRLRGETDVNQNDRDLRLQIMLQPEELAAIENWRFTHHMPSRAAAVRELLKRGLAAEGFTLALPGKSSSEYGVTE